MDVHNPFILVQLILDLGAYFRTCIPSFLSHFLSVVLPGLLREHMYVCGYKASHLWTIVQWIYWPCRYLYKMSSAPPGALGARSLQMTHFTARVPSFGWRTKSTWTDKSDFVLFIWQKCWKVRPQGGSGYVCVLWYIFCFCPIWAGDLQRPPWQGLKLVQ